MEKDEETMSKNIQSLGHYPDPVWLLIFAEGTRLNPEKLEASRDFARKRGYPVLRHCKYLYGLFSLLTFVIIRTLLYSLTIEQFLMHVWPHFTHQLYKQLLYS